MPELTAIDDFSEQPQPAAAPLTLTSTPTTPTAQSTDLQLAPLTAAEVQKGSTQFTIQQQAKQFAAGRQPQEEAPSALALMTYLHREKQDQAQYLISKLGPERVRVDDHGDFMIKMADPITGKEKEVPLNAHRMSANDFMFLLAQAPEAVGAMLGARAGKAIPGIGGLGGKLGFLRDIAAGSTGAELVGGVKDVIAREASGQEIRPGEIAEARGKGVGVDIGFGYTLAGTAKVGKGIWDIVPKPSWMGGTASPLGMFRGPVQNEAIAAQKRLAGETGIEIPMTMAEATGVPFLAKMQGYIYKHPAGARPILIQQALQDERKRAFQSFMLQPTTLQNDTQVGNAIVSELDAQIAPVKEEIQKSAEAAGTKASTAIKDKLTALTGGVAEQKYPDVSGEAIREKLITGRDAAKAEQERLRQEIAAIPGATGKQFESQAIGLTAKAQNQLDRLPSAEQTITTLSSIVSPTGERQPITQTVTQLEKEFVPSRVVSRLQELSKAKKYSLHDLIQMRSDVYEDIAAGQAVPGTGTHYLNEIGKMLGEAIDTGIEKMPNDPLKVALQAANKQYKTEVLPFKSKGISDLFARVTEPGYVESSKIPERLINNPDQYRQMVGFLGKGSTEHNQLKRFMAENIMENSKSAPLGDALDAEDFVKNLDNFRKTNRRAFDDVFGASGTFFVDQAKTAEVAGLLKNGKINADDARKIMSGSTPDIVKLIDARRKFENLYKNTVIRDVIDGKVSPDTIDADELVSKLPEVASIGELGQILGVLSGNPDLREQIGRKMIEKTLLKASRYPTAEDIVKKARGEPTQVVSGIGIFNALGDATNQKKLELLMGGNQFRMLKDYMTVEAAGDWARKEAGETGIFASGNAVGGFLHKGISEGEISSFLKFKILAVAMANSGLNKWFSATYQPGELKNLAQAVVTSEPFIKGLTEEFTDNNTLKSVLTTLKRSVGLTGGQPPADQTGPAKTPIEQF